MKYYFFVFQSRNILFDFVNYLKKRGILIQIVNTPRGLTKSCSLSARCNIDQMHQILDLINIKSIDGLTAIFAYSGNGFSGKFERLY